MATQIAAMRRNVGHREPSQDSVRGLARDLARDFAYITIFAIGCGTLGAISAALLEVGVWRLCA